MRNRFALSLLSCIAAAAIVVSLPEVANAQIRIKIPNPIRKDQPTTQPAPTQPASRPGVPATPNTRGTTPGSASSGDAAEKQRNRQLFNQMKTDVQNVFQAVQYFYPIYKDPTEYSTLSNYGTKESLAALAELDQLCRTKYAGIKDFGSHWGWEESPETWCDVAAKREALAERLKVNQVMRSVDVKSELAGGDGALERLNTGDGFITDGWLDAIFDPAKYKREHQATKKFAEAGIAMPADFFAPLDEKIKALSDAADKRAATATFPAVKYRDPAIEQWVRAKFKEWHNVTVLKIHVTDTEWRVHKNSLGVPTVRYRGGVVLLKPAGAAGAKWCQHRTFSVKDNYQGNGRWGERGLDFSGSAELMKCQ